MGIEEYSGGRFLAGYFERGAARADGELELAAISRVDQEGQGDGGRHDAKILHFHPDLAAFVVHFGEGEVDTRGTVKPDAGPFAELAFAGKFESSQELI